jgi:hypothetical protein
VKIQFKLLKRKVPAQFTKMLIDSFGEVSYIARALTRMLKKARTFKVLRRAPVFGILEKEEATKFVRAVTSKTTKIIAPKC